MIDGRSIDAGGNVTVLSDGRVQAAVGSDLAGQLELNFSGYIASN